MEYYITHRGKSQHIVVINSLSVWGLGGPYQIATAKARLVARVDRLFANERVYLDNWCEKVLERGVGETKYFACEIFP